MVECPSVRMRNAIRLCRINLWAHWARAQGPAPRGAPHLEDAFKNNKKTRQIERVKKKKEGKEGEKE